MTLEPEAQEELVRRISGYPFGLIQAFNVLIGMTKSGTITIDDVKENIDEIVHESLDSL